MASEEARKAVVERLGWEIEGGLPYRLTGYVALPSERLLAAFNLCVSLQERVEVLEEALRGMLRAYENTRQSAPQREVAWDNATAALSPKEPA